MEPYKEINERLAYLIEKINIIEKKSSDIKGLGWGILIILMLMGWLK